MQNEQRLVNELVKHWRRWKGAKPLPMYETFAPEALEAHVWQQCCTFSVVKAGEKVLYMTDYIGAGAEEAIGKSISGDVMIIEKPYAQAARLLKKAEDVLRRCEPEIDEGHFVNAESKIVKFRSCLLPFGREKTITHLVLGLSWRAF